MYTYYNYFFLFISCMNIINPFFALISFFALLFLIYTNTNRNQDKAILF